MVNYKALTATICLFSILLQGCANNRYFKPKEYDTADLGKHCGTFDKDLCKSQAFARARASEYGKAFIDSQQGTSWYDFFLIAAAAGTAGSLMYGAHIDVVKGLGLGGATLAGYKGYFLNKQAGEYFLKAEEAARCVAREAKAFDGADISWYDKPSKVLLEDIVKARTVLSDPLLDPKSDEFKALATAVEVADSSINMGKRAVNAVSTASADVIDHVHIIDLKVNKFLTNNSADVTDIVRQVKESSKASAEQAVQQTKISVQSEVVESLVQAYVKKTSEESLTNDQALKNKAMDLARSLNTHSSALTAPIKQFLDAEAKVNLCTLSL